MHDKFTLDKVNNKDKRKSTNDFQHTSMHLEKAKDHKKVSKRQTLQVIGENSGPNSPVKSTTLSLNLLSKKYDDYILPVYSNKKIGPIKSFSYTTYRGIIKEYNEDKVSVASIIEKPPNSKFSPWPKMSYFAIFDGHGGEDCSEYLRDNFLQFLVENKNFPFDIKVAMTEAFKEIEESFFKLKCKDTLEESNISGSCALVAVIFDNKVYMANIGDSRAIMSINNGTKIKQLTVDHKPDNLTEFERALKNGSKIYLDDNDDPFRDESTLEFIKDKTELEKMKEIKDNNTDDEKIFRVYPSDLAVMRTIGDIKAKKKEFGGVPGTIINIPDIFVFEINCNNDFIVMGCDGIFDDLSNEEIVNAAWLAFKNRGKEKNYDIHELSMEACDLIIKYGLEKQTTDNLSCIVIGLEGVEKFLKMNQLKKKVNNSMNNFKKEFKRSSTIK